MNENYITQNFGKFLYALIILLAGFLIAIVVCTAGKIDGDYQARIAQYQNAIAELEAGKSELEAELGRVRKSVDYRTQNIGRAADNIDASVKRALDAVQCLEQVQRQIQESFMDIVGDSGRGSCVGDSQIKGD
jgi:septal ring factor EnvC (AmiA/AmiB activator)